MLRLGRRLADTVAIAAGGLVPLALLGIDPTAALAGLGIGGIAVALAAQKTLENVIGGVSIIFDQAVRVGDFLKLGETVGTVDESACIDPHPYTGSHHRQRAERPDRECEHRDAFGTRQVLVSPLRRAWLRDQRRPDAIGHRRYSRLSRQPQDGRSSEPIRARFIRFGPFSLDIEVFVYILASDWAAFLDTQQELLLDVMDVVELAGRRSHFRRRRCTWPMGPMKGQTP